MSSKNKQAKVSKSASLSRTEITALLNDTTNNVYLEKEHIDNVLHVQALYDNMLHDAYNMHNMYLLHVEALQEDYTRKLAIYTARERNNEVRRRLNEEATKFSKCIKKESQSYLIEKSLEQFRTLAEHAMIAHVDAKRVKRHIAFLQKEQCHTCAMQVHDTDKTKFRFVVIA